MERELVSDACAELMILVWAAYNPELNIPLLKTIERKYWEDLPNAHEREAVRKVWAEARNDWRVRGRPGT